MNLGSKTVEENVEIKQYRCIAWFPGHGMLGPGKSTKGFPRFPDVPSTLTVLVEGFSQEKFKLVKRIQRFLFTSKTCYYISGSFLDQDPQ